LGFHLGRDDVRECCLTEAWGAKEKRVVERLATIARSADEDPEIGLEPLRSWPTNSVSRRGLRVSS